MPAVVSVWDDHDAFYFGSNAIPPLMAWQRRSARELEMLLEEIFSGTANAPAVRKETWAQRKTRRSRERNARRRCEKAEEEERIMFEKAALEAQREAIARQRKTRRTHAQNVRRRRAEKERSALLRDLRDRRNREKAEEEERVLLRLALQAQRKAFTHYANALRDSAAADVPAAEEEEGEKKEAQAASPEPTRSDEDNSCVICLDQERTHAAVPCGHLRFCGDCVLIMKIHDRNPPCPMCRGKVEMFVEIR